jgi:CheY-like chemotaxis protein
MNETPNFSTLMLVDDEPDTLLFVRTLARKAGITSPIKSLQTGIRAIGYLSQAIEEGALPKWVLLDLDMPGVDGFEVLQWIRTQPILDGLTVCVLSSSDAPEDLVRTRALGADSYLVKYPSVERFRLLHDIVLRAEDRAMLAHRLDVDGFASREQPEWNGHLVVRSCGFEQPVPLHG